jgi:hypothetical protein
LQQAHEREGKLTAKLQQAEGAAAKQKQRADIAEDELSRLGDSAGRRGGSDSSLQTQGSFVLGAGTGNRAGNDESIATLLGEDNSDEIQTASTEELGAHFQPVNIQRQHTPHLDLKLASGTAPLHPLALLDVGEIADHSWFKQGEGAARTKKKGDTDEDGAKEWRA